MPKLESLDVRRKRLPGEVTRIPISVTFGFLKELDSFREEFRNVTKRKISRAYMFREGVREFMRGLRTQMKKAQKGVLHAKPRK